MFRLIKVLEPLRNKALAQLFNSCKTIRFWLSKYWFILIVQFINYLNFNKEKSICIKYVCMSVKHQRRALLRKVLLTFLLALLTYLAERVSNSLLSPFSIWSALTSDFSAISIRLISQVLSLCFIKWFTRELSSTLQYAGNLLRYL